MVALVVMVPLAILSYRRRGRAGGWTAVVVYGFVFYLLAAVLQTIVPLPRDPGAYCGSLTTRPQLHLFSFVEEVGYRARGHWGLGAMVRNPALMSTVLNVLLLVPLGFFLRYVTRVRLVGAVGVGFGVSLFFELTQLTGLWFVYPCAYRLFSVDDLMLNTVGAGLGWVLAALVGRFLPDLDPERERRRYAARVTPSRRLFALLVDVVGFGVATGFVLGLTILFGGPESTTEPVVLGVALVWFLLVPMMSGATVGKRALLLRVRRTDGRRAGAVAMLVRNGVLFSPAWLLWLVLSVRHWSITEHPGQAALLLGLAVSVFLVGVWAPLAVFFGDGPAPHERLSRTRNVAVPAESAAVPEPVALAAQR